MLKGTNKEKYKKFVEINNVYIKIYFKCRYEV